MKSNFKPFLTTLYKIDPIAILSWLFISIIIFFLKFQIMSSIGYRVVEKGLGREKLTIDSYNFTFIERLSFFSMDIVICLLVIPSFFLLINYFYKTKIAAKLVAIFSFIVLTILFIQVQSQLIIGSPTSYVMFIDSIKYSLAEPDIAFSYISLSAYIKFSLVFIIAALAVYLSHYFSTKNHIENNFFSRCSKIISLTIFLALFLSLLMAIVLLAIRPLPHTKYHDSLLLQYADSFIGNNNIAFKMKNPSEEKLIAKYKRIANIQPTSIDKVSSVQLQKSLGQHKGSDLIVVILETAPSQIVPISAENNDLQHIKQLLPNSLYSNNHFTTFPFSNLAIFSLFTSWYPTGETLDLFMRYKPELPSFIQPLKTSGYKTKLFIPCQHSFEFDELFYRKVGIESDFKACESIDVKDNAIDKISQVILKDKLALDTMINEIKFNIKNEQPYAYVFAPQVGHGPWPDISGHAKDTQDKGRAIIALQDEWIGELIDELKNSNKLQDTVILITGDHGIRTRKEDPIFPGNVIDEYSYKVPFILHAPKATQIINRELNINTSHVDISPTLLHLFGHNPDIDYPQGMNLNDKPYDRTIFFNGKYYLSADGFSDGKNYFAVNAITGQVHFNPNRLNFSDSDLQLFNSTTSHFVQKKMDQFYALQNGWQAYFFQLPPKKVSKE